MITICDLNCSQKREINLTNFPDGTKLIKCDACDKSRDFAITWLYDNDAELFQLISISKHLKKFGRKVHLLMPYIPNARMDRTKGNDEVFTLKAFADTINWLGFYSVEVCNPHSTVSEALFDSLNVNFDCVREDVGNIVREMNLDITAIFYPDEGAGKRYGDVLNGINLPYAFGVKKRDWRTGNILGLDVIDNGIDIRGKNILIVDDICSRGGTFLHSAKKLKELGSNKIYLYVTHCENTILEGELVKDNDLIEKIFTTNSIFRKEHEKVQVIRNF